MSDSSKNLNYKFRFYLLKLCKSLISDCLCIIILQICFPFFYLIKMRICIFMYDFLKNMQNFRQHFENYNIKKAQEMKICRISICNGL